MQTQVAVVGHYGVPFAHLALLTTEHPLCAYGFPIVIVNDRPHLPVDAALEGWHILPTGRGDEEVVNAWQGVVARYTRIHKNRALRLGPISQPIAGRSLTAPSVSATRKG